MAIREDLVSSAVTFLQDPSVAAAPLEKRMAFLQSKNLTQEEIDASLARAGDPVPQPGPAPNNYTYPAQVARQPPPPYGYGGQQGYWQQQPPPPDVPRRDWRDYFIMATVMSGLGYGAYFIAKRYIVPLIAPPTPPQIEQDKSQIDEAFNRAFALIEQLSNDTAEIKKSEEDRKERLDSALSDFESTIQELKDASRRRDDDTRRIGDEVRSLQGMIPKAMKTQEENADHRLKELNEEMKSLKRLIGNRLGGAAAAPTTGASIGRPAASANGGNSTAPEENANAVSATPDPINANPMSSNPLDRFSSGKGGIPTWQLEAAKKNAETKAASAGVNGSSAGA